MKLAIPPGTTSYIARVFIQDATSTIGAGKTGLTNASSITWAYIRIGQTTATSVSLVSSSIGSWFSGGFKEVDSSKLPGVYEIGVPNAALSAGTVHMQIIGSGIFCAPIEIQTDNVPPAAISTGDLNTTQQNTIANLVAGNVPQATDFVTTMDANSIKLMGIIAKTQLIATNSGDSPNAITAQGQVTLASTAAALATAVTTLAGDMTSAQSSLATAIANAITTLAADITATQGTITTAVTSSTTTLATDISTAVTTIAADIAAISGGGGGGGNATVEGFTSDGIAALRAALANRTINVVSPLVVGTCGSPTITIVAGDDYLFADSPERAINFPPFVGTFPDWTNATAAVEFGILTYPVTITTRTGSSRVMYFELHAADTTALAATTDEDSGYAILFDLVVTLASGSRTTIINNGTLILQPNV